MIPIIIAITIACTTISGTEDATVKKKCVGEQFECVALGYPAIPSDRRVLAILGKCLKKHAK